MAGLIPQHIIDDLLDRTDIVDLIDGRVALRKSGRNYAGLCPFHNEKSPSFTVSPDKQFYHCFGCGAHGNAITFLMEFEHQEFPVAVETLARAAGIEIPAEREQHSPQQQQQKQQQQSLYDVLARAQQFYSRQLREHPTRQRAIAYLKGRQLSGEIAKTFAIGYAPPGWENLHMALATSDTDRQQLVDAGLLIRHEARESFYDRFRDRIIFPIRDSRGRTIAFGGRVLGDDKPKYLNSPESPVFQKGNELYGLYEARQASNRLTQLLIVEGYMDVVALAQHGIENAVATLGTATTAAHLKKLFRHVSEIVICFDGDAAGRKAAVRALETALPLMEDGRQIRFMFLPDGEDPDSLVRREGRGGFAARLKQAIPLTNYFFASLSEGLDLDTLDGQARLSKLALEKMRAMPQGILYELMLQELSTRTGLSTARLAETAAQTAPAQHAPQPEYVAGFQSPYDAEDPGYTDYPPYTADSAPAAVQFDRRSRRKVMAPAEKALALLLHNPALAADVAGETIEALACIDSDSIRQLTALLALLQEQPALDTAAILAHWQGRHGETATNDLKTLASSEQLIPPAEQPDYLQSVLSLIRKHHQEQQLEQLLKQASHTRLSEAEKHQLQALLRARHNP